MTRRVAAQLALQLAISGACGVVAAQDARPRATLPPVTVTAVARDPVEKSYRKMVQGMDLFEQLKATMAPEATLRFRLLPRRAGTDMDRITLEVIGSTVGYEVPIAPDRTFVLDRDAAALREDAVVSPNRKRLSMTWRTEIRSPGVPEGTRRLGDLRLECRIGMEAELVSNSSPLARVANLLTDPRTYCDRRNAKYLYFAEKPIFSVTLVHGARREVLPIDQLYAMASDDPQLAGDLPYCDCEVLVDRTYFLPLGDPSWPDDTRVEYETMSERP